MVRKTLEASLGKGWQQFRDRRRDQTDLTPVQTYSIRWGEV